MSKETQELNQMMSLDGVTKRFQSLSDQSLIKKFHNYPIISLILNLITLGLFLTSFFKLSSSADSNPFFITLALGCISIIVFQKVYPSYYRKAIARAMMNKYKTTGDTQTNEYYYYYRQEYETLGELKKSAFETVCTVLGVIVKIINIFFNLLTALLALAFSLAFGIMIGGVLWLFHFVLGGNSTILELSRLCFKPVKWSLSFLGRVLSLKDYLSLNKNSFSETDFGGAKQSSGTDREMSDTYLREYITTPDNTVLPPNVEWDGTPEIQVFHTLINVRGRIKVSASAYKHNYELNQCLDKTHDNINEHISNQINKFRRDFPNSSDINIHIDLEGYIG